MAEMKAAVPAVLLTLILAGCASAQGTSPRSDPGPPATTETVSISQPPARSYVGFSWSSRNRGRQVVTAVEEGSPAAAAGFTVGDTILAVDGRDSLEHVANFRLLTPGQTYLVRVRGTSGERELTLVPAVPSSRPRR